MLILRLKKLKIKQPHSENVSVASLVFLISIFCMGVLRKKCSWCHQQCKQRFRRTVHKTRFRSGTHPRACVHAGGNKQEITETLWYSCYVKLKTHFDIFLLYTVAKNLSEHLVYKNIGVFTLQHNWKYTPFFGTSRNTVDNIASALDSERRQPSYETRCRLAVATNAVVRHTTPHWAESARYRAISMDNWLKTVKQFHYNVYFIYT